MKLGICTTPQNASAARRAGFSYIEPALSQIAGMSGADAADSFESLRRSGLRAEAMCVMLPGGMRLSGPEADHGAACAYLEGAFARAASFGAVLQVFGSGGVRRAPEGFPPDEARAQLAAFLRLAAPIAHAHGIRIAIEPLRPAECNLINTVADALALQELAGDDRVGVLADWYHMADQNEPADALVAADGRLLHCHIANPAGRRFPLPNDGADYTAFFAALGRIGYRGRVSVEGNGEPGEFPAACARLKEFA